MLPAIRMARERIETGRGGVLGRARSALTIAGLDPSGGAGLTADLRAFRAASVWGAAACAVLTVQSTAGLAEAHAVEPSLLRAQVDALFDDLDVRALKTGALGSEANVRLTAELLAEHAHVPSVVDPVMAPTLAKSEGARLDGGASSEAIWSLVRVASLVTPNAVEAAALLGRPVRTNDEARAAAADLVRAGARAVLLKGGHIEGADRSIDWLATPRTLVPIARARRTTPPLHGTGCTLSALIAGRLASASPRHLTDDALLAAIRWARAAFDRALRAPVMIGRGARVLDVLPRPRGTGSTKGAGSARSGGSASSGGSARSGSARSGGSARGVKMERAGEAAR
jgi:hydroxymethylpyrimidine/phosphomethylpyrimidine kinase